MNQRLSIPLWVASLSNRAFGYVAACSGSVTRIVALTALVACCSATCATAGAISFTSKKELLPQDPVLNWQKVLQSVAVPGGFITVGGDDPDHLLVMRIDNAGNIRRRRTVDHAGLESPYVVAASKSSGIVIAGDGFTRDVRKETKGNPHWLELLRSVKFQYVRRIEENGDTSTIRLAPIQEDRFLSCVQETAAGYLLAGAQSTGRGQAHPWIALFDRLGNKVWEHVIVAQGDSLLYQPIIREFKQCPGLIVALNGSINWISDVEALPEKSVGVTPSWAQQDIRVPSTFFVRLDSEGEITDKRLRSNASGGALFGADNILTIAETDMPDVFGKISSATEKIDQASRILRESAIAIAVVGSGADLSKSTKYAPSDFVSTIESGYRTPSGSVWLAGCVRIGGMTFLLHISPDGKMDYAWPNGRAGPSQCDLISIGRGDNPENVVILGSSQMRGVRWMAASYSN